MKQAISKLCRRRIRRPKKREPHRSEVLLFIWTVGKLKRLFRLKSVAKMGNRRPFMQRNTSFFLPWLPVIRFAIKLVHET